MRCRNYNTAVGFLPCKCEDCKYVVGDWKKVFRLIPRKSIGRKKIKGKIYKRSAKKLEQNGHYVHFREYADAKEIFKQKLKGAK